MPTPTPTSTSTPTIVPTSTPVLAKCRFVDDRDPSVTVTISDSGWRFAGRGLDVSGTHILRVLSGIFVIERVGQVRVIGWGACNNGPALFWAMQSQPPQKAVSLFDSIP